MALLRRLDFGAVFAEHSLRWTAGGGRPYVIQAASTKKSGAGCGADPCSMSSACPYGTLAPFTSPTTLSVEWHAELVEAGSHLLLRKSSHGRFLSCQRNVTFLSIRGLSWAAGGEPQRPLRFTKVVVLAESRPTLPQSTRKDGAPALRRAQMHRSFTSLRMTNLYLRQ